MIEINISLDPINDGAKFIPKETEVKSEGAIIIGTDANSKIISEAEALNLLEKLQGCSTCEFIGRTPYMAIMNDKKIITIGGKRYFVGSALVLKSNRNGISMLGTDDYERVRNAFSARLEVLVCNGQHFYGYEIC